MIPVTRPFLPPYEAYAAVIQEVFQRNWLTNNGPVLNELELRLKQHLDLKYGLVVGNGTIALQIGLRALGMKGKVLTTPFSYIATASSIAWEGCTPVFVDIEPNGFNVTPETIAQHLDEEVGGIVLTHCFGMPLDVERLDALAAEAGVPIMYDAAHAFGSTVNGKSIFTYGDISTCSFHATKIFHCVEGGAIFARRPETIKQSALLRNFGHSGLTDFAAVGINGKNSEMHAAMGVVNLNYIDGLLEERKGQTHTYTRLLASERRLTIPEWETPGWNHAYYPVLFENEEATVKVMEFLNGFGIYPRRYFYPSLHTFNGWEGDCPNSTDVSSRVLCLPLYHGLTTMEQEMIARYILRTLRN